MELRDKLELSQRGFERELKRVEELTATLAARDQSHVVELAAKAKELADCETVRSSELEQNKKLDANCNEMQSQLSAVE